MYLPVCALAVQISSNQGSWYASSVCKFRVAILPFYCSNSFIDLLGLGFILLNLAVVYIYRCKQRSFGQILFKTAFFCVKKTGFVFKLQNNFFQRRAPELIL